MTSGQIYAGKQRKAADLKGRLHNTLENIEDPQVLANLNHLVNNYLKQIKIQQQELTAARNRYNSVPANDNRTDWAMEWLVG